MCAGGAVTLQNCNAEVTEVDICAEIEAGDNEGNEYEVNVCGLDVANSTNGSEIVQSGDSEGLVYDQTYRASGEIVANGLISAGNDTGTEVLFSDIVSVESALSGYLATT